MSDDNQKTPREQIANAIDNGATLIDAIAMGRRLGVEDTEIITYYNSK